MNPQPLVSIIMNCYNGEKYLEDSLKSIISQTYQNWELIFWDNLSTDKSRKIFEKYKDKRFKYFLAEKHSDLYEARNLAIKKISGDFIAFLDTDDVWFKDKLSKQIQLFSDETVGLVYGNYWRYNKLSFFKKNKLVTYKKLPSGKITDQLLKEYFIGILTIIVRKKFINLEKDMFDTRFDMISDMDFVLKFSKNHNFDCVQEPIAMYRLHENQLQNKNLDKQSEHFCKWYEKIRLSKEFGANEKLLSIKNKCKFFKILKYINKKFYFKSIKEIIFYPNNVNKIKLFIMLITPRNIFNRIINLR